MTNISELTDYNWIYNRLRTTNCHTLVADYQVAIASADDNATVLHLLKAVFDLTVYILDNDPEQLSSQLYGRLIGYKGYFLQLDALLDQIWNLPKADLLPIHPTMPQIELEGEQHQPRQINRTHTWYVTSIAVGKDVVASAAGDGTATVWNWQTGQKIRSLHTDVSIDYLKTKGEYLLGSGRRFRNPNGNLLGRKLVVWNWKNGSKLIEEWHNTSNRMEQVAQKYLGHNLKLFHSRYQIEFTHFSGTFEKRNPDGIAKKYLKSYGVVEMLKESFGVLARFKDIDHGCFQIVVVDDQMLIGGMLSGQLHFLHIKPPAHML